MSIEGHLDQRTGKAKAQFLNKKKLGFCYDL
jgi:hypothetical protein